METKIVCPRCRKFVHAYNKFRQFKFDFSHLKSAVGLGLVYKIKIAQTKQIKQTTIMGCHYELVD